MKSVLLIISLSSGGDSLLAISLSIRINEIMKVRVNIQALFENPTIVKLANLISNMQGCFEDTNNITKVEKKEHYHTSSAQKRMYYASLADGEASILYNIPSILVLDKKPDFSSLNESFKSLISNHTSLRTSFVIIDGELMQKVEPFVNFEIVTEETESLDIQEISKDFVRPFDLSKAPLIRAKLAYLKDGRCLLLIDMHHIISDGTSTSIITKEISDTYNELTSSSMSISNNHVLSDEDKNKLIYDFNDTEMPYIKSKTVIDLFEEQVVKNPNSIALVFGNQNFTYEDLNNKANQLGRYLIKNKVKPKDIVGIMVHRSPEMIVSILAILKIGATYLPIDPSYPIDRINYMLSDSNTELVLVHSDTLNLDIGDTYRKINVDLNLDIFSDTLCDNINIAINPEGLIYLIYTSRFYW